MTCAVRQYTMEHVIMQLDNNIQRPCCDPMLVRQYYIRIYTGTAHSERVCRTCDCGEVEDQHHQHTVEPLYSGHLRDRSQCPYFRGSFVHLSMQLEQQALSSLEKCPQCRVPLYMCVHTHVLNTFSPQWNLLIHPILQLLVSMCVVNRGNPLCMTL